MGSFKTRRLLFPLRLFYSATFVAEKSLIQRFVPFP